MAKFVTDFEETMPELDDYRPEEESLEDIKKWLFQERVRIQARHDELMDFNRELTELKNKLDGEKSRLEAKEKAIKKRYDENELFIARKLKIIEDAYCQLDVDRKALECERLNFEHEKSKYRRQKMSGSSRAGVHQYSGAEAYDGTGFFRGVDSELALRKRYKELLKIFHPDNKCGDTKTLVKIQSEYESLRGRYYGEG